MGMIMGNFIIAENDPIRKTHNNSIKGERHWRSNLVGKVIPNYNRSSHVLLICMEIEMKPRRGDEEGGQIQVHRGMLFVSCSSCNIRKTTPTGGAIKIKLRSLRRLLGSDVALWQLNYVSHHRESFGTDPPNAIYATQISRHDDEERRIERLMGCIYAKDLLFQHPHIVHSLLDYATDYLSAAEWRTIGMGIY